MATLTHLDTHVVVWVVTGEHQRLSQVAIEAIEDHRLEVSPMVALELAYLREVGRVDLDPADVLGELRRSLDLRESQELFGPVAEVAQGLSWTRDPFDRLIVAQAITAGAHLLTRDDTIHAGYEGALW